MDENTHLLVASGIVCIECRREWIEPSERWRVYLTPDELRTPVPYCPDCAHREFDP